MADPKARHVGYEIARHRSLPSAVSWIGVAESHSDTSSLSRRGGRAFRSQPERGVAPAESLDQRPLIGFGLPVGGLGADDLAQGSAKLRDEVATARIFGFIRCFVRVACEVEKLGRISDVFVILPAPLAQHERAGGGADRVIFR